MFCPAGAYLQQLTVNSMLGSLLLGLSLSATAQADNTVAVELPAEAGLVGDADAVGKKKADKKKADKGKAKEDSRSGSAERSAEPGPVSGEKVTGPQQSARPDERASRQRQGREVDTERDDGRSAERSREPNEGGRAERGGDEGRERASSRSESAERRSDHGGGAARHRSGDRHEASSHRNAGRHAPAYRVAARHRSAVHASASRHHAAWSARHRPYAWHRAWAPGRPHYWYHGVFVYGPRAVVVVDGDGGGNGGDGSRAGSKAPNRSMDRAGDFSIGVHSGSYLSNFGPGEGYGDAGLGLSVRYRPAEALGFEAAWTYHDASWSADTARIQQPLQVSAQVFAFPWTRVSPYVLAGITMTDRNLDQPLAREPALQTEAALWGPHAGIGIEFAVGKNVGLDFDARFIGYMNKPADDPSSAGAVQGKMGLNFYF